METVERGIGGDPEHHWFDGRAIASLLTRLLGFLTLRLLAQREGLPGRGNDLPLGVQRHDPDTLRACVDPQKTLAGIQGGVHVAAGSRRRRWR